MALTTINSDGVKDDSIKNIDVKSDAAIAGTKISPDFGSQNIVTTGSISGAAGTLTGDLTIPDTIVHTGDSDTKIRFSAADTVAVETGGEERFRINSTGQTIVGDSIAQLSTSAERPFQVHSINGPKIAIGRNDTSITDGNTIGGLEFYGNDANGTFVNTASIIVNADGTHGDNDKPTRMQFYTTADDGSSATEKLRIDSDGRLQIGSSTNTGYNDFDGVGRLSLNNNSADGTVDFTQGIVFTSNASNEGTWTHAGIVTTGSTGYDGNLIFGTDGANSRDQASITEKMRITADGDVGIGTTSPSELLQIGNDSGTPGGLKIAGQSSSVTDEGLTIDWTSSNEARLFSESSGDATMHFYTTSSGTRGERLRIDSGGKTTSYGEIALSSGGAERLNISSPGGGDIAISNPTAAHLIFKTNNTEEVRILNGGGITFNGDTAAANALDDYEEGTWTPTVSSGGTAFTVTGSRYVKIGAQVTLWFDITNGSGSGTANIYGLPFTPTNVHGNWNIGYYEVGSATTSEDPTHHGGFVDYGTPRLSCRVPGGSVGWTIADSTRLIGCAVYWTTD